MGAPLWRLPAAYPATDDETGEEDWACPRQPLKWQPTEWGMLLLFYGMYLKGHLPDPGAVSEQGAYALDCFILLDEVNRTCDRVLDEERKRREGK